LFILSHLCYNGGASHLIINIVGHHSTYQDIKYFARTIQFAIAALGG